MNGARTLGVEIVGPPGSGKSTVGALVAELLGVTIVTGARSGRYVGTRLLAAREVVRAATSGAPPPTRQGLRWIGRLGSMEHVVGASDPPFVIVDQGPVYTLARLLPGRDGRSQRWWNDQIERWAPGLGAVVMLDAADEELWARISARAKSHSLRGAPVEVAVREIRRQRTALERTVACFEDAGVPVHRMTSEASTPRAVAQEFVELPIIRALEERTTRQATGGTACEHW